MTAKLPDPRTETGRIPKYYRVKQQLREHLDGSAAGEALPTERALSEAFGAARATVRQALQELAAEGRVVRIQGKGTFVLPPKLTIPLELVSHTEAMRSRDLVPGSRVLELASIPASEELARALEVPLGSDVVKIARLRLADGEPMAIETVHVPADRFTRIEERIHDWTSLYHLLTRGYDVELAAAEQTIETAVASPSEARILGTDSGAPLLLMTRRSWSTDSRPVEYTESLYRGDRYRFVTTMQPPRR